MKMENKVALVTGGANGIGASTALELAGRGADIVISYLQDDDAANEMKTKIEKLGRKCKLFKADLSKPENAVGCVNAAVQEFNGLDILVHSAGGLTKGGLMELEPEQWVRAFDVHVHAVFYLCRAAVPVMKQRGEGAIVLISSSAGLRGCAGAIAYGVVKGAIPQFTRALARELADDNIRVNAVAPGIIRTRFQDILTPEQAKNNIDNRIPLHREGKPEDVAEVIAMLATNEFITGETVTIDGGMSMRIA